MTVIGEARRFHNKFKFQIEIDDIGRFAFQSCSELKAEVQKIEYYEGGMLYPYKEPGRISFADLTLERAVCNADSSAYRWLEQCVYAAGHSGDSTPAFKRTGTIVQLDRDNERIRTWTLFGIWPLSFTAGSWDNTSDDFVMESIVLAIDYFTLGKNVDGGGKPRNVVANLVNSVTNPLK